MNNKKRSACNTPGLTELDNQLLMKNHNTIQCAFQYRCSFCWRELPNGSVRFAGFGVCPPHLKLAETIVDLLRGHAANYFNSGVAKR
jgi:hypothetical protein